MAFTTIAKAVDFLQTDGINLLPKVAWGKSAREKELILNDRETLLNIDPETLDTNACTKLILGHRESFLTLLCAIERVDKQITRNTRVDRKTTRKSS